MSDLEDSMSEIDWSEAPCWASHWCPVCKSWLNEDEDIIDTCCIPLPAKTERDQDTSTEWVDGLPPVGDECEVKELGTGEWQKMKITSVTDCFVIGYIRPDRESALDLYHARWKYEFRPIRTESERQRDELIRVIRECDEPDDIADTILSKYNITEK